MRFIWVPYCQNDESRQKALDAIVDPYGMGTEGFAGFDESGEGVKTPCRVVSGWYVKNFITLARSDQNKSLGHVINGGALTHHGGDVALAASSLSFDDGEELLPIDALPHDLPKLLQCLARTELQAGSRVKMELVDFDMDESDEDEDKDSEEQ